MSLMNETHDPALKSWVQSANADGTDFPIQNLPIAVFRRKGSNEDFRGGVAIGEHILDLAAALKTNVFSGETQAAAVAAAQSTLNAFMAMGPQANSALRLLLSHRLREGPPEAAKLKACLVSQSSAQYAMPANVGDYTDFYTSVHHAPSVGRLFRPDAPLLPNYKWIPIGYHGRSSTIDVSGQEFHRPIGQTMAPGKSAPDFGPCKRLDYELEMGVFVGVDNAIGQRINIRDAEAHIFGLCLLNDWSARDIQAWEYQPLGPFLSKNFASTISPWIVTLEALAPYRVEWIRPQGDPQPLSYLDSAPTRERGALDIQIEVWLETLKMREAGEPAV